MNELAAGVLSSLIAVVIVEIYLAGRRLLTYRNQRKVWHLPKGDAFIIAPIFRTSQGASKQLDLQGGLLSTYDALGIAHLLGAAPRVGISLALQPFNLLPPEGITSGIALGGPASNAVTKDLLEQFFPGFRPIFIDTANHELSTPSGLNITGWSCDQRKYEDDGRAGRAFVARLCSDVSGMDGVMHVCFGLSDVGTAAASYILAEHSAHLRKLGSGTYFAAIRVQRNNGYRAVGVDALDITKPALTHPSD